MVLLIKCSCFNHEGLSLGPYIKKSGAANTRTCLEFPYGGIRDRRIPGCLWSATPTESMSSRFSERVYLKS